MADPRIGTYNDDGSVQAWPDVTITGRTYVRPVSVTHLSPRHFCVTDNDTATIEERDALIAELRDLCREKITPVVVSAESTGDALADFEAHQASQGIPGFSKGQRK